MYYFYPLYYLNSQIGQIALIAKHFIYIYVMKVRKFVMSKQTQMFGWIVGCRSVKMNFLQIFG